MNTDTPISPCSANPQQSNEPKCETCMDTKCICIVETDDGDFIEDVCPDCGANPQASVDLMGANHVHRWGTKGQKWNGPDVEDRCYGCGQRYGSLAIGAHIVDPSLAPLKVMPGDPNPQASVD